MGGGPIGPPYRSVEPAGRLSLGLVEYHQWGLVQLHLASVLGHAEELGDPAQGDQGQGRHACRLEPAEGAVAQVAQAPDLPGEPGDVGGTGHGIPPLGLPHGSRSRAPAKGVRAIDKRREWIGPDR